MTKIKEYKIFTTREFDRDFLKLDKSIKKRVEDEIEQLKSNPYVGKSLGYKFFREKKVKKFRFYYLIYDEYIVVFIVALSEKKDQQKAINTIKHLIPYYRNLIRKKLNQ